MAEPHDINDGGVRAETEPPASPVVGIGASAGGLAAFESFLRAVPTDSRMAYVLVQHLDPSHRSELAELLQNHTDLPVERIEDRTRLAPDHVYVLPPNAMLELEGDVLRLVARGRDPGAATTVDRFFRALARELGERAIGVVLSGTGSDGTLGIRAIKEAGGITLAQSEEDAEYDGMPRSAAATGLVDFVLAAADMPAKLVEVKDLAVQLRLPATSGSGLRSDHAEAVQRILTQLASRTGHDFGGYKRSTVLRRLTRRLQVHGTTDFADYLEVLRTHPSEANALFRELLIGVTTFFRDPDAFAALEAEAVPSLFGGDEVRVWVPGCATGEEAYSVAMLLAEHNATLARPLPVQVFATDLDGNALDVARRGVYPHTIADDVTPERLARFFEEKDDGYAVRGMLREQVLFTQHNLVRDPPFSRLDLVSCRNLLIYLESELQEGVYRLFHYALRPDRYLFLGASESLGRSTSLFDEVDRQAKLFRRRPVVRTDTAFPITSSAPRLGRQQAAAAGASERPAPGELARRALLAEFAPACAVVNQNHDIVYVSGGTGRYLELPAGEPTRNIVQQARDGLSIELRTALYRAFRRREATDGRRVRIGRDGEATELRLSVRPLADAPELALVVFEASESAAEPPGGGSERSTQQLAVEQLEDELARTRESLQTTIEELETSNEELHASNEELQSMNEELQSTAEELETSREELQSTNEELVTVNQELRGKVEELADVNGDLENLIGSTDVATLFLDAELRLKRFTPRTTDVFNLIHADLGRPFAHVSHAFEEDFADRAREVLATLVAVKFEAETGDGGTYLVRILPYRTLDNRIDGLVMTLVEVTEIKRAQREASRRAEQQAVIAELGLQALSVADLDALMDTLVVRVRDTLGVDYVKVLEGLPDTPELLLRAGVGWSEGLVGSARVGTGADSQAGYTLQAQGPVIVEDLGTETRFGGPALLTDHGVTSGLSVIVEGRRGPFGVFGVHARARRAFDENDVNFVQAAANVIAQAVERAEAERALQRANERLEERVREATEELRSTNRQLREQGAFLRGIYDEVGLAVYVIDVEGDDFRYRGVNPAFEKLTGLTPDRVIGRRPQDLDHLDAETIERSIERYRAGIETGTVSEGEIHVPDEAGGEWWLVSLHPVADDDGTVYRLIGTGLRITERKRAEARLRASEERFRAVFEQGPSAACLLILDGGDVIDANSKVEGVLGLSAETIAGRSVADLGIWPDPQELDALRALIDAAEEGREIDLTARRDDGETRVLRVSLEVIEFAEQEHALLILYDVTDQRRIEADLREARSRLVEVQEAERLALARELHDDVIQQLLSLNQALARPAVGGERDLEGHRREVLLLVDRLRRRISDLRPAGLEEFGLRATLENLAARMSGAPDAPAFESRLEEVEGLSPQAVRALFRVAQEALRNAVRHAGARRIELALRARDGEAVLTVRDDGSGFEVPSRLSGLVRDDHFGLIGIEEQLTLLGGRLSLDSRPGAGTTLVASVPATERGSRG